ncbi:MAG: DMT family transporter [Candidatus Caenarcaniphilales bacterium]|nr:DMT family transporter [Candidatus Caenarcaniphilales bacterium]
MLKVGIFYGFGAAFFFSLMALSVKLVDLPAQETILARGIVTSILCFIYMRRQGIHPLGRPENFKTLIIRGLLGYLALFLYFFSLEKIPLSQAALINSSSPIFASCIAAFFLREKLSWSNIFTLISGMAGILVLTGFGSISDKLSIPWEYWAASLVSVIVTSSAYNLVRRLILEGEEPDVIVFCFSFLSIPLSLLLGWYEMKIPSSLVQWGLLLMVGICAHMGQVFLTRSFETAKTSEVTGMLYFGNLFSAIWGVIFFKEEISLQLILGAVLIIGGQLIPLFLRKVDLSSKQTR